MCDQRAWERAVALLNGLNASLAPAAAARMEQLVGDYRDLKSAMAEITSSAGGSQLCRACGGLCCQNGKYRMSALDAYAHIVSARMLPVPDFSAGPLCPYGSSHGCRMEAAFRPASCIQFICGELAGLLPPGGEAILEEQEQRLREMEALSERLTGLPLARPLLLMGEAA